MITFSFSGPRPRSVGQMGVDRRRDLGQSDRAGAKPKGCQGLRTSARPDSQRKSGRIRRIQVSSYVLMPYVLDWGPTWAREAKLMGVQMTSEQPFLPPVSA